MPKNSNHKTLNTVALPPAKPIYSDDVEKWINRKKNASLLDTFYAGIDCLNSPESRNRQLTGKDYDYRRKLYHMHFGKKIAIFYTYINKVLHVELVLRHYNDQNRWKAY